MKKILFVALLVLMLTGCKNEMKCSLEQDEEVYTTKQDVVFKLDDDGFVVSSETELTMIFDKEEDAQEYYNIFKDLEQESALELNKNKIIMGDSVEYSDQTKASDIKKQLEDTGYKCK